MHSRITFYVIQKLVRSRGAAAPPRPTLYPPLCRGVGCRICGKMSFSIWILEWKTQRVTGSYSASWDLWLCHSHYMYVLYSSKVSLCMLSRFSAALICCHPAKWWMEIVKPALKSYKAGQTTDPNARPLPDPLLTTARLCPVSSGQWSFWRS